MLWSFIFFELMLTFATQHSLETQKFSKKNSMQPIYEITHISISSVSFLPFNFEYLDSNWRFEVKYQSTRFAD